MSRINSQAILFSCTKKLKFYRNKFKSSGIFCHQKFWILCKIQTSILFHQKSRVFERNHVKSSSINFERKAQICAKQRASETSSKARVSVAKNAWIFVKNKQQNSIFFCHQKCFRHGFPSKFIRKKQSLKAWVLQDLKARLFSATKKLKFSSRINSKAGIFSDTKSLDFSSRINSNARVFSLTKLLKFRTKTNRSWSIFCHQKAQVFVMNLLKASNSSNLRQ